MNYLLPPELAAQINARSWGAGLVDLDPRIAATLEHGPDCRRPRLFVFVRTRDGAPQLRCSSCGRYMILRGRWLFTVLESAGYHVGAEDVTKVSSRVRSHPVPVETPPPAPAVVSRYWCRDHPDQPVDHRGRGCVECR